VCAANTAHREKRLRQSELKLSHDEIRRLAALAERERIGRDLHDLLGHTLSLITLKSELAVRLFDRDPLASRREIVDVLAKREASVSELVALFHVSQPAISQHLKVLREAGLVRVRPDAQRRLYSIDPKGLKEVSAWLNRYRKFWATRLDRLDAHMEAKP